MFTGDVFSIASIFLLISPLGHPSLCNILAKQLIWLSLVTQNLLPVIATRYVLLPTVTCTPLSERAAASLTEDKTRLSGKVRFLVKEFHEHPKFTGAGDNIHVYLKNKPIFISITNITPTWQQKIVVPCPYNNKLYSWNIIVHSTS